MLAEQFTAAAAAARNTAAVDEIARLTWRAHAEGQTADAEAEAISEALQGRRAAFAARRAHKPCRTRPPLARRRPSAALAGQTGEPRAPPPPGRCRRRPARDRRPLHHRPSSPRWPSSRANVSGAGSARLPIDAIAALAGVSRTTTQNALRAAKAQGLIFARERRRPGLPSLTNVLKVISTEWAAWLKLSGEGGGYRKLSATNNKFIQERKGAQAHGLLEQSQERRG